LTEGLSFARIVYTRGVVQDGNFSAVHQKQKKPEDDVMLSKGDGFMAEQTRYQAHLAVAKEYKEVSAPMKLQKIYLQLTSN
jgi:hypothetical protein